MAASLGKALWNFGLYRLIFPPLLVGALCPVALGLFFQNARSASAPCWQIDTVWSNAAAGGISVAIGFILFLVACSGAIAMSISFVHKRVRWTPLGAVLGLGYLAVAIALVANFANWGPGIGNLGWTAFSTTVGSYLETQSPTCVKAPSKPSTATQTGPAATPAPSVPPAEADHPQTAPRHGHWGHAHGLAAGDNLLTNLLMTLRWSGILIIFVTAALTVAVVSLSYDAPLPAPAQLVGDPPHLLSAARHTLDEAARELAERIRALRYLAFAGAAVLVTGVAFVKSWADWPLAFWTAVDKADTAGVAFAASYRTIEAAVLGFQGVYLALVMAVIFAPLGIVLSQRAHDIALLDPALAAHPENRADWLDNHGLSVTAGQQILRVLLLLSPLLAAPVAAGITQLFNLIVKH